MSEPTREQVQAAGKRTLELLNKLQAVLAGHFEAYPAVATSDLDCDTFTAVVQLLTVMTAETGTPPLQVLQVVAEELGVKTINATTKSVGHG